MSPGQVYKVLTGTAVTFQKYVYTVASEWIRSVYHDMKSNLELVD